MNHILIDTNLLIYLFDDHEPRKQSQAQKVLSHLEITNTGRLSVQSLAEFISVSTRKIAPPLTPAEALKSVEWFSQIWPVIPLTPAIVLEAGRGFRDYQLSYFDAQIWATAHLNQIPIVFTEDLSDGQLLEGVRLVNPFAESFVLENWTS
jgi:predicted nucleic acid-binding protein